MDATREHVILVAHELSMLLARPHVPQPHRLIIRTSDRKVLVLACAEHFRQSGPNGLKSSDGHESRRWRRYTTGRRERAELDVVNSLLVLVEQ